MRSKEQKAQLDERIQFVIAMIRRGAYKHQIKKGLKAQFQCSNHSCERYITAARTAIGEEMGKPKELHRAEALSVYQEVLKSDDAELRIKAQDCMCKLLGLNEPVNQNHTMRGFMSHKVEVEYEKDWGRRFDFVLEDDSSADNGS